MLGLVGGYLLYQGSTSRSTHEFRLNVIGILREFQVQIGGAVAEWPRAQIVRGELNKNKKDSRLAPSPWQEQYLKTLRRRLRNGQLPALSIPNKLSPNLGIGLKMLSFL